LSPNESRAAAACAIVGAGLLIVGTYLHPVPEDPNDAMAAFAAYAADRAWVASHLIQLAGVTLIVAALLLLARQLMEARDAWPRIAAAGAIASLAVVTALQAVDGVALKRMVDMWAAAPAAQKQTVFYAASAVRQIEIGLASTSSLLFGLTTMAFGVALLRNSGYPIWLGALALIGGIATALSGLVMAYTGFSGLAMAISMPADLSLLVWTFALGVSMWRRGALQTNAG
jgi:hypothetical protein